MGSMSNKNNPQKEDKKLITTITSENDREYYLYSDGNLYEKDSEGNLKQLRNVNEQTKQLIDKIMNKFSYGKTDVIRTDNSNNSPERIMIVELPEL